MQLLRLLALQIVFDLELLSEPPPEEAPPAHGSNVVPAEAAQVPGLVAALNLGKVVALPTDTLYGEHPNILQSSPPPPSPPL